MNEQELNQRLKLNHDNFLSLQETRSLISNLIHRLENDVSVILAHSVLDKMSDSQIRMLCAKAEATKEIIDYVSKEPSSIVRSVQR